MEIRTDRFQTFLDSSREKLEQEIAQLCKDNRKDEADFVRIKCNIYGIANGFYEHTKRFALPEQVKESYLQHFEQARMPQKWIEIFNKAKENNDIVKMVQEEIKIQTLKEIKEAFHNFYRMEEHNERDRSNPVI